MISPPDIAIAAATVVVLRDAPAGWELLLLERHAATAFAGGAMVFPGGRVDPGDAVVATDAALATGFAGLDAVDAAARVAAAREAFEEAEVLLATGEALDSTHRRAARARLNAGTLAWGDFLRASALHLDAAALVPFASWIPPAAAPIARRFDTMFYLAHMPAHGVATADGHEAVDLHWTTPAAALARADAGEIGLVFPTRRNQPEIVARADGQWLTIPADCDYPVTEEALTAVRRE